jgi:hypothetical protein
MGKNDGRTHSALELKEQHKQLIQAHTKNKSARILN